MSDVELETARNTMETLDRRQVALDGRQPQFLSSKDVRDVLEQLPHIGRAVTAMAQKNG